MSQSFGSWSVLTPNCNPLTLEWHVQPWNSAATDPKAPATLQSGFDWCFQHVQTNSLNQISNRTAQKSVPNTSSRQLLEHFLAYLQDGTFAVYTGVSWKAFVLPVFVAWPPAHSGRLENVQPAAKQHPELSCQNHKIPTQQHAGLQCVSPRCCIPVWGIF